ncbi:T9SS type B sorting domain-containing protein [Flavobacteriaceae bacterium XHP0103]|uniref:T9SS type B sorting domain-containing protein n=1 Tax=Marixanthotalea marina TaxID=2844359 RepID=UPI002989F86C|nr:T9SS type B sorting domain-containing protein [Marixanthotalea marina]MBU3822423.1 T9SS type B sorting domain-containing protein [Marixanthotalea marina]
MPKLKFIILIIVSLLATNGVAQKETNRWYFGINLEIDFNSGSPVLSTSGKTDPQVSFNRESAVISDKNGNLLFYTDGKSVWNKNHEIMPNGTNIRGGNSPLIVPKPDNPNVYYILSVGAGLEYAEVNLNNGLGEVTSFNNQVSDLPIIPQITAYKNPVCEEEYWVVAHEDWNRDTKITNNRFLAYKITNQGISTDPVVSPLGGDIYYEKISENNYEGYGGMLIKLSPDGKKLAMGGKDQGQLTLSDFDLSTGMVSNIKYLNFKAKSVEFSPNSNVLYAAKLRDDNDPTPNGLYQFNIESNNQTEIYNSKVLIVNETENNTIHDELQLASNGKIYINVYGENDLNALDVINSPNTVGHGCNYEYRSVVMPGNRRGYYTDLPNFMSSYFREPEISFENLCYGDTTAFYPTNTAGSIIWDFGDPATGANNTSTDTEPTHVYSAPGCYNVTATATITSISSIQNGSVITTKTVIYNETVTIYPLPKVEPLVELVQCENDLDGFSQFNLNEVVDKISANAINEIFTFYESETDAISGSNVITDPTAYTNSIPSLDMVWARVEDSNGCFSTSQINLKVTNTQIPSTFLRNFYACDDLDGDETNGISVFDFSNVENEILSILPNPDDLLIHFYRNEADALSESNPIEDISNYSNIGYPFTQDIYVRVDNKIYNDCVGLGKHISLTVNPSPDFFIEPRQFLCVSEHNSSLVLDPFESNPQEAFNYTWTFNGEIIATTPTLTITNPGDYSITLTKIDGTGCSRTETVSVIDSETATISQNDISVVDLSDNNSLTIKNPSSLGSGDYWFSLESNDGQIAYPYQDEPVFNNLKGGIYTLYVADKKGCGIATLPISVIGYPKFFTPNDDGINDFWQIQGISNLIQPNSSIQIFDRYGKLLKQLSPSEIGWNGTFNGQVLSTDDYWFRLLLEDGRTVLGHFALKR